MESILMKSVIKKGIVVDQVWSIYNGNVPETLDQYELKGMSKDAYEYRKTRVNKRNGSRETEEVARNRYKKYDDCASTDLKKILRHIKSPLVNYENSKDVTEIPVIVAATFAAIFDMRKYFHYTPTDIIKEITDQEIDEEILIKCKVDFAINHYDGDTYFLKRLVENLKYFFNVEPELEETNLAEIRTFEYKFREENGKIHIEPQTKKKAGNIVNVDKEQVLNEILEFKNHYIKSIKRQGVIKKKAKDTINQVEEILKNYCGKETDDLKVLIKNRVYSTFGLNEDRKNEMDYVFPIDFTDSEYDACHFTLDENQKCRFYTERRNKLRGMGLKDTDDKTISDLYNETNQMIRKKKLIKKIETELTQFNNKMYNKTQYNIRNIDII